MLEQMKVNTEMLLEKCEPRLEMLVLVMPIECSGGKEPQWSHSAASCCICGDPHPGSEPEHLHSCLGTVNGCPSAPLAVDCPSALLTTEPDNSLQWGLSFRHLATSWPLPSGSLSVPAENSRLFLL